MKIIYNTAYMTRDEFITPQTSLTATEEIDLTGFKLVKENFPTSTEYKFEKRFPNCKDNLENQKAMIELYDRYEEIINTTSIYAQGGGTVPMLIKVANFIIPDSWQVNNGQPIHCTATVNSMSLLKDRITFSLSVHLIHDKKVQIKPIKLITDPYMFFID